MRAGLTSRQREQLMQALRSRRDLLAAGVRSREEPDGLQSGGVGDRIGRPMAEMMSGIEEAKTPREAAELREIDAALARVDDGSYGLCARCGVDIRFERLQARPTAQRCLGCQAAFEARHGYAT